jgi:hypothetical protein
MKSQGLLLLNWMIVNKSVRKYRIKNKVTGQYYAGFNEYKRIKNSGRTKRLVPVPVFKDFPYNFTPTYLSDEIRSLIYDKLQSVLDDCEIETVEIREVPIKGTLRMKNIRRREEQKVIIAKLKHDQ